MIGVLPLIFINIIDFNQYAMKCKIYKLAFRR